MDCPGGVLKEFEFKSPEDFIRKPGLSLDFKTHGKILEKTKYIFGIPVARRESTESLEKVILSVLEELESVDASIWVFVGADEVFYDELKELFDQKFGESLGQGRLAIRFVDAIYYPENFVLKSQDSSFNSFKNLYKVAKD